jgi:hypothetical protein
MPSRFLLAVCAIAMAASFVWGAAPAQAYDRSFSDETCVVALPGARLYPLYSRGCDHCCCRPPAPRWVRPGRAFRIEGQRGGYLQVRHLQASGWIEYRCLRIVPEYYCIAAGI